LETGQLVSKGTILDSLHIPRNLDLFDLTPVEAHTSGYLNPVWPELERATHTMRTGTVSSGDKIARLFQKREIRQIHPPADAGTLLHPAHRRPIG